MLCATTCPCQRRVVPCGSPVAEPSPGRTPDGLEGAPSVVVRAMAPALRLCVLRTVGSQRRSNQSTLVKRDAGRGRHISSACSSPSCRWLPDSRRHSWSSQGSKSAAEAGRRIGGSLSLVAVSTRDKSAGRGEMPLRRPPCASKSCKWRFGKRSVSYPLATTGWWCCPGSMTARPTRNPPWPFPTY